MAGVKNVRRTVDASHPSVGRLLLLSGLLVGFALRLHHLGNESLWYDETVSVHLARLPLAEMLARTAGDIHPPAYYALLHAWQALAQPSLAHGLEFLFAWPSLVLGVLALPLLFATGRRLFGERTAVAALWLAALNPFQVWYSQEVRMYTLGAALGLLCLWAVLQFAGRTPAAEAARPHQPVRSGWLVVYVVSAAAGLYTLYYFLFVLLALNMIALLFFWLYENKNTATRWRQTVYWLAAQVAVLLLWSPWLPTFWRQATNPPVPPWRSTWDSPSALIHSLQETMAALLVGQSPPGADLWPWAVMAALFTAAFIALGILRGRRQTATARRRLWLHLAVVLLYVFIPIGVLYTATLLGAPIYHVRYLSIYAPLFVLVAAWLLVGAWRLHAWLGAAIWAGLLAMSAFALLAFWTNPIHRADDHRAAVAALAAAWRPGDVILANAGWIYPVLTTYWPTQGAMDGASTPPPLAPPVRLLDYAQNPAAIRLTAPQMIRTGSVDGSPALGWGSPDADFFAVSRDDTLAALDALALQARRIWHYRLYDTVSDPDGAIRTWLDEHTTLLSDTPIPGRDFGRVQLYTTPQLARDAISAAPADAPPQAVFGDALALLAASTPATTTAGSYLYADLLWQALPPLATLPTDLSVSLRLYDAAGQQVTQADAPPAIPPTRTWDASTRYLQSAALPIPSQTPPGLYTLQLVVYRQDNAEALPTSGNGDQLWQLAEVDIKAATLDLK